MYRFNRTENYWRISFIVHNGKVCLRCVEA